MIRIDVLGTPAPKGSNRAMLRGGRAVFVPGGSKPNQVALKSWDVNVREAAIIRHAEHASSAAPLFVATPLTVAIVFRLARPGGHWHPKTGALKPKSPARPAGKPDVDKLARSTLDSLTGLVFDDDSRIVELTVRKEYAAPGQEGASIAVDAWSAP